MSCVTECQWMSLNVTRDNVTFCIVWYSVVRFPNPLLLKWLSSQMGNLARYWGTHAMSNVSECHKRQCLGSVNVSGCHSECQWVQSECGSGWVTHAAILPPFCRVNLPGFQLYYTILHFTENTNTDTYTYCRVNLAPASSPDTDEQHLWYGDRTATLYWKYKYRYKYILSCKSGRCTTEKCTEMHSIFQEYCTEEQQ